MFCLIGKSGSGKDMLADILEGRGYHRIRAYTTRPRRDGEDENAYFWVSEIMFIDQMAHEEFLETCSYETAYGKWYYGTPWPTVGKTSDKYFYILSPTGYEKAVKNLPDDVSLKCIYVDSNNKTLLKRLRKRNNNQDREEILRRFEADKKDFMKAYDLSDLVICNVDGTDPENLADQIEDFLRTGRKQVRGIYPHDGYPHD